MSTEAQPDAMYDEIGGALRIKEIQQEKRELFEALELSIKYLCSGKMCLRSKKMR